MKKMKGSETYSCDPEKQKYVRRFIQEGHWSPEQLSNRLKLESAEVQIGYAAIYRTLKAWVFDWNKRAISRSKSRRSPIIFDAREKRGKKWDKRRQDPHFCDAGYMTAHSQPMTAANWEILSRISLWASAEKHVSYLW